MEEQKKKSAPQNEGAPREGKQRISVRQGNFMPPKSAAPAPTGEQKSSAPHHRGNNRRGKGKHGAPQQQNEQKSPVVQPTQVAPTPAAQPKKQGGEQKQPAAAHNGQNRGQKRRAKGNGSAPREGGAQVTPPAREQRQKQKAPQTRDSGRQKNPRRETPALSEHLQRELDEEFSRIPLSSFREAKSQAEAEVIDTSEFEVDIATAAYLTEDVPCGFPVPDGKAVEVIGVRFRHAGKIYFFAPGDEKFRVGDAAIVDTARGAEYGEVVMLNRKIAEKNVIQPLRPVLRRATEADIAHYNENRENEIEAMRVCTEKIAKHKLDMRLVDAQYAFDNTKLLFYFTSEGRVDFRDLVRDLAGVFRTRIELRQIGIRDEAKLIGGLGMCGRPFCCATFLSDFGQVSIKMAKEQGLSINTSKISGCCGRLMCCMRYEYETYREETRLTPAKDTVVETKQGRGVVVESAPLAGTVKVRLDATPDEAPVTFRREEVTPVCPRKAEESEESTPTQEEPS